METTDTTAAAAQQAIAKVSQQIALRRDNGQKQAMYADHLHLWDAVILGLIEGISEFLPISSTGHLLLAEHWIRPQTDLFNTVIQMGTVLAVITTFYRRLLAMLRWPRGDDLNHRWLRPLLIAFMITAVGGLLLHHFDFQLPDTILPVAWATLIGGLVLLWIERLPIHPHQTIGDGHAVLVGLAQLVAAVFPGSSRSGSVIVAMLLLGHGRAAATDFSFMLGIPTLLAAGALQLKSVLVAGAAMPPQNWASLWVATLVATGTAFVAVNGFLSFVRNHSLAIFGYYRIVLGGLLIACHAAGTL